MPVFLVERNFAEKLEENRELSAEINRINADAGVQWLISFLSADKKKTYCLYEAPSAEAIREAARRAGIPADVIIEVGELRPTGEMGEVLRERFHQAL
jgi:hypothetical protein